MDVMGRRYPKEFRDDVVRLAERGDINYSQFATDFAVSGTSIYDWVKQVDIDDGVRAGLTQEEADELCEVKRHNGVLEEENLILRRAAAFFANDVLKLPGFYAGVLV